VSLFPAIYLDSRVHWNAHFRISTEVILVCSYKGYVQLINITICILYLLDK